jgi:outer membrane protein assembly factor BamA
MIIEQPFLFSRNISGRLETFLKSYRISTVDYQNLGLVFTSGFDRPSYAFINVLNPYFRLDRLSYEFPFPVPEIPDTATINTRTFTTSLGVETASTNTNDIFYPTEGRLISLISEIASSDVLWESDEQFTSQQLELIQDVGYYYKLQLTLGLYQTVSRDKNTVVAIKFKTGYIDMFSGGEELVSPNQTFFAGGSNSVRGWRARELIPSQQIEYIGAPDINEELKIRGGTMLLEGSFEWRRRFETDLGYALFVDYGNTWNSFNQITWNGIAWAIGAGIRYYSPIAPFRLDFGFKLYDPKNGKFITEIKALKTMEFHFGIGEAF